MFKANGKGNAVRLVLSVATVAVLAACSSPQERKMANRGFEYEESRLEGRAFLVPAGLSTPAFNSNFDIPALPESSREGALGAKVDKLLRRMELTDIALAAAADALATPKLARWKTAEA